MITGPHVIIALKLAVSLVTAILLFAIIAIATGNKKLHGRLNTINFVLTMLTLVGFEVIIRIIFPDMTASFTPEQRRRLFIHLCFAIPSALLLPIMMFTGATHRRTTHLRVSVVFGILWMGTFITGLMLPHDF